MKYRPILFSGPMVRALLDGRKTQTRRIVKPRPFFPCFIATDPITPRFSQDGFEPAPLSTVLTRCPYGQPGDRLWVREATGRVEDHGYTGPVYVESEDGRACLDGGLAPSPEDCTEVEPYELHIRPSIHMPRTYCRIVLEVTRVRVERLQEINEADAIAEGLVPGVRETGDTCDFWKSSADTFSQYSWAPDAYREIWESISGAGAWDVNPWVWAVDFRVAATSEGGASMNDRPADTRLAVASSYL